MTELKTLKDIETERVFNGADVLASSDETPIDKEYILKEELKAEAVKWIKGDLALFEFGSTTWNFINHFFNLTEQDLEEAKK